MNVQDDLLEQGFQLACFIVGDRTAAIQILTSSINKLKTRCRDERKKNYWRDKYLKRRITRIAKGDRDTLQWLIYFESDPYEQRQEQSGQCTTRDMVIRYIKCLVQITTGMSSFYVNIGLNRLFYNYSTTELQKFYETLTELYLGPDEYRRGKRLLMDRLETRFGKFLATARTEHGEMRFVPADNQDHWIDVVRDCLTAFTPWSTAGSCLIPAGFDAGSYDLTSVFSNRGQKVDQNAMEINRCHALIEPGCFTRLSQGLRLGAPKGRLALPRFTMKSDDDKTDRAGGEPQIPPLTEQERSNIRQTLGTEAERRRRALPQSLRIRVDGVEPANIRLHGECNSSFAIPEGAKLIEIWTEHQGEDLLLATHLISYQESQGMVPSSATIALRDAGVLTLNVSPAKAGDDARSGQVSLSYHPYRFRLGGRMLIPRIAHRFGVVPLFSLIAALLLAVGWALSSISLHSQLANQRLVTSRLQSDLSSERALRSSVDQQLASAIAGEPVLYNLVPDEGVTRGADNVPMPEVSLPPHLGLVNLQLPVAEARGHTYRATLTLFARPEEILTQNLLAPARAAAGLVILFSVPSHLLESRQDYTVHLKQRSGAGALDEIGSFSFHVK